MTLIENDSPKVQYTGPFVKGQLLPLTFPYIAKTDVHMLIDGVPAELNKEFEIITEVSAEHPVAYPNSAYIKNALPNAKQITLYRSTPLDQQAPFPQGSKFRSERIEQALDKLTMQQQEQEEQLSRCVIAPITLETFNGQLPEPAADQALKWNTEGTALENYDIIGEQEAFENDVNTRFEEQSIAFENRVSEFEENTNAQFAGFRAEINENLETVLDAAEKLEKLDNSVQAAENAASQANAAAARADEAVVAADQAVDEAESAADQAEEALTEVKEFIQNAEDEISQYYSLPMFTPIWSDHILNDASYLRADTFSWHNGDIYRTAYNTLLAEFTSPDCVHESENGVTYRRTPSGFKIADPNKHDAVLNAFTSTGKSWFYVIDPDNKRFKLPRTKFGFTGIRDTVGGNVDAGLPSLSSNSTGAHTHTRGTMEITGQVAKVGGPSGVTASGAFTYTKTNGDYYNDVTAGDAGTLKLTASKSWTGATSSAGAHSHTITDSAGVLGKSNTVQPPATQMYLYFFIGNYARPQADIDIGELVEIVNERDFTAQVTSSKAELNTTKNNCIKEINSTSVGGRVLKTGDTMTGTLRINTAVNNNKALRLASAGIDISTAPSSSQYSMIEFLDKNGTRVGILGGVQTTNGDYGVYMQAGNIGSIHLRTDGTTAYATAPTPAAGDNSTKIATTAYCVNMRCTTKATTTSSASTTRPCWIVQNYVNGTSWYRVWSDGWIEQGGQLSLNANAWGTVTFLKTFANANYSITALAQGANTSTADIFVGWKISTKTAASVQLGGRYISTNGAIVISWEARGY